MQSHLRERDAIVGRDLIPSGYCVLLSLVIQENLFLLRIEKYNLRKVEKQKSRGAEEQRSRGVEE
jgi:hypothetical protein